ncbi:50S ribosomal protein L10 [bacterium]|jgi:large subunit ribosomal protein L10|nr:50S ribosomal protein L10 [bacterium]MBT6831712.1 50S ribosomal protein L10 [bacterium]MBT6996535.1 50S ribosomal protein L10 [bacterium]MBT7772861.1 50S ribosomal protein L10 [bacterium]
MATPRSKKSTQLEALETKFRDAAGVAFVKFDQVTVEEAQTVRRDLRSKGMSYSVIKKTLMALAAKNVGLADFDSDLLPGSVAVIVSPDDTVLPSQEVKRLKKEFFDKKKDLAKFDFAGAIFDGNFLDVAASTEFANTSTREESLAKIVGMLRSGPQKLHNVFNSGFQRLYNVLENADKFSS